MDGLVNLSIGSASNISQAPLPPPSSPLSVEGNCCPNPCDLQTSVSPIKPSWPILQLSNSSSSLPTFPVFNHCSQILPFQLPPIATSAFCGTVAPKSLETFLLRQSKGSFLCHLDPQQPGGICVTWRSRSEDKTIKSIYFTDSEFLKSHIGVAGMRPLNVQAINQQYESAQCCSAYQDVSLDEAIEMLKGAPQGTYLVRKSTSSTFGMTIQFKAMECSPAISCSLDMSEKVWTIPLSEDQCYSFANFDEITQHLKFLGAPLSLLTEYSIDSVEETSALQFLTHAIPTLTKLTIKAADFDKSIDQYSFAVYSPPLERWIHTGVRELIIESSAFSGGHAFPELISHFPNLQHIMLDKTTFSMPSTHILGSFASMNFQIHFKGCKQASTYPTPQGFIECCEPITRSMLDRSVDNEVLNLCSFEYHAETTG